MSEKRPETPLLIEIAESLKQNGTFQRDFGESEIAGIMSGVISSLMSSPEAKEQAVTIGGVENMNVLIKQKKGTVSGEVQVEKPMAVKIPVKFVLANSTDPENLKLDQISIGSGFSKFAIAALGKVLGVDIEAVVREQLKNPNKALAEAFSAELLPQGVKLTGVGLHFKDIALSVSLKGEAVNRSKLSKEPEQAKPSAPAEAPSADGEWLKKRGRVRRYLDEGGGMDFIQRTYKDDLWKHVGVDGSVKQTYRPLKGVLAQERLCLRENVRDRIGPAYGSASDLRKETNFLESVKGKYFIKVYARAPYNRSDSQGFGEYKDANHWELVDFVEGITVEQEFDREHDGSYWPEPLSPAVRLRVLLAACENEYEAITLSKPVYLTDLKTDAFIVSPDGEQIKQVDCQTHDDYVDTAQSVVATELVRLCLELFPAKAHFSSTDIEKAIRWYLNPQNYENEKRWFMHGENPPVLTEILNLSRHVMPNGLDTAVLRFLDKVKNEPLKIEQVSMAMENLVLPIAQRTEREESAARTEKLVAEARQEVKRRAAERVVNAPVAPEAGAKSWEVVVGDMIKSPYFTSVYESTGSAIAASAAYQMREKIEQRMIGKMEYLTRVNKVVAETGKNRLKPEKQKIKPLALSALTKALAENGTARVAYGNSNSLTAAAVAYELREEIGSGKIGKEKFINLVKLINSLVNGEPR
jgi:hypothetical protein